MIYTKSPANILYLFFLMTFLSSCELIVLNSKKQKREIVNLSQDTPLGAIYLFKTELDSNNYQAAAQIFAKKDGKKYSAIEKYDMYYEMERYSRIIDKKSVTKVMSDTISNDSLKFLVQLNYWQNLNFETQKIDDIWYVTDFNIQEN